MKHSLERSRPLGGESWTRRTARVSDLTHTLRPRGRRVVSAMTRPFAARGARLGPDGHGGSNPSGIFSWSSGRGKSILEERKRTRKRIGRGCTCCTVPARPRTFLFFNSNGDNFGPGAIENAEGVTKPTQKDTIVVAWVCLISRHFRDMICLHGTGSQVAEFGSGRFD